MAASTRANGPRTCRCGGTTARRSPRLTSAGCSARSCFPQWSRSTSGRRAGKTRPRRTAPAGATTCATCSPAASGRRRPTRRRSSCVPSTRQRATHATCRRRLPSHRDRRRRRRSRSRPSTMAPSLPMRIAPARPCGNGLSMTSQPVPRQPTPAASLRTAPGRFRTSGATFRGGSPSFTARSSRPPRTAAPPGSRLATITRTAADSPRMARA